MTDTTTVIRTIIWERDWYDLVFRIACDRWPADSQHWTNGAPVYYIDHTATQNWHSMHTLELGIFSSEWSRIYAVVKLLNSGLHTAYDPVEFCREVLG